MKENLFLSYFCEKVVWIFSMVVILFGFLSILYHHFDLISFDGSFAKYAPTYLAGWSFLLAGVALLNVSIRGSFPFYKLLSLFILVFSLYSIGSKVFGDVGLFRFMGYSVSTPLTALTFLFISMFFFLFSNTRGSNARNIIVTILTLIVFFLSLVGLVSHALPFAAEYILKGSTSIQVTTALVLLVLSLGMIASVLVSMFYDIRLIQKDLPYFIYIFFLIISFLFSFGIWSENRSATNRIFITKSNEIKIGIGKELDKNAQNLRLLNLNSSEKDPKKREEWLDLCRVILNNNSAWLTVQLYDADFELEAEVKATTLSQTRSSVFTLPDVMVERAHKESPAHLLSSLYIFPPGSNKANLLMFVTEKNEGKLEGGVGILIDLEIFIKQALSTKVSESYAIEVDVSDANIEVVLQGVPIYSSNIDKELTLKDREYKQAFEAYDTNWTIIVAPTKSYIKSQAAYLLFWISIIGGIIISVSVGSLAILWQKGVLQIIEIKEVQLELQKSKEILDLTLAFADIGIWRWEIEKDIVHFDEQMFGFFGLKNEMKMMKFSDTISFVCPKDREQYKKSIYTAVKEGTFLSFVFRSIWPDHSLHYIQFKGKLRADGKDHPLELMGGAWDVTELHKAMEKQTKIEEKLRLFNETVEEWIWEIDTNHIITYSNPSIIKILGYTEDEVVGKDFLLLIKDEFQKDSEIVYSSCLQKKTGFLNRSVKWKHKDGTYRWIETNTVPFFSDSHEVLGFRAASRDISDRKKVEELKDEFLSNVSHELRTPLTSIYGSLGLLLGKHQAEFAKETFELLDIAYRNAKRLLFLINQLLDFQKLSESKLVYNMKPLCIKDVLIESIKVNEAIAKIAGISLKIQDPLSEAYVNGDFEKILEVMTNLLSNAIKFSGAKSSVTISTEDKGDSVRVMVMDQGRGIPKDFKDKIFQRFTQVDVSKTIPGTGLGLYICKTILENMQGKINFTSEEGKGSVFYFDLPIYKEVN